jgi:hypothetical protein
LLLIISPFISNKEKKENITDKLSFYDHFFFNRDSANFS